jgi:hypothetical protein
MPRYFNALLNSVCKYLIEQFCTFVQENWTIISFFFCLYPILISGWCYLHTVSLLVSSLSILLNHLRSTGTTSLNVR